MRRGRGTAAAGAAMAIALSGCALDLSGLGPSGTDGGGPACPPGWVDANGDPADGCERACPAPGPELCNGVDDDCLPATADGAADPAVGAPCDGADDDLCAEGATVCAGGTVVCDDPTGNSRELCNGVDDDCDGEVDEEAQDALLLSPDEDGDGYGSGAAFLLSCVLVPTYAPTPGDCDDLDPAIRPGAPEACNGVDDDCTGRIDDGPGCACVSELRLGSRYDFCRSGETWDEARESCGGRGAALVKIEDAAENAWVRERATLTGLGSAWIGLSDGGLEGAFTWLDGSAPSYTAWGPGEPNDGDSLIVWEDCAELTPAGTWNDQECGVDRPYVCERPAP